MFEYLAVFSFHLEFMTLKFYFICEHFLLFNRISHACSIHMSKAYKKAREIHADITILVFHLTEQVLKEQNRFLGINHFLSI